MIPDLTIEKTFQVRLKGVVQGVGFRPFVYRLAKRWGLNGWVGNSRDGVQIEFNANELTATKFYEQIIDEAPKHSRIVEHSLTEIFSKNFDSFKIVESDRASEPFVMLTPDFAMCDTCKMELADKDNKRYQYPFITCTVCGPRYSIIATLPYDRANTSMSHFEMCKDCGAEFNNVDDRRYYSQTNSCGACGPTMEIYDKRGKLSSDNAFIVQSIVDQLNKGRILAIKGVGGYLFICDAENQEAIKELRTRKHRPSKPFAVMFPDLCAIEAVAYLSNKEKRSLQSVTAPIVLLQTKHNTDTKICLHEIAPRLSSVGAMLPYAPLYELILSRFRKPVVATSANMSGAPIVYQNNIAREFLFDVADFIVTNDRNIEIPQDDSVVQFSPNRQKKLILRRSRGMAPSFFNYKCKSAKTILAAGASMKSSFTFVNNKNVYVSQYLGDTEDYGAQQSYKSTVNHFLNLFAKRPDVVLTDRHPQYFSGQFAKGFSDECHARWGEVQHHKAHFAAVLAENGLLSQRAQVLGVIWDGTGLGEDKNIWGGEFFIYEKMRMQRAVHFSYFPFLLGDKMPKEPRISALAICHSVPGGVEWLKDKFSATEWKLYNGLLKQSILQCSSVGRIFDAVSSLLAICDRQSFEGEAAMLLQQQSLEYFNKFGWAVTDVYSDCFDENGIIDIILLMKGILHDLGQNLSVELISAKFHWTLVKIIRGVAEKLHISKIACSGGVFQNAVLTDLMRIDMMNDFELYFHKELASNDENISFGQFVYYDNDMDGLRSSMKQRDMRPELTEISDC